MTTPTKTPSRDDIKHQWMIERGLMELDAAEGCFSPDVAAFFRAALTPQEGVEDVVAEAKDFGASIKIKGSGPVDEEKTRSQLTAGAVMFAEHLKSRLYAQGRTHAPDGWKLVPIEPTEEMIMAARPKGLQQTVGQAWGTALREDWANMLSASPAHQSQNEGG